MSNKLEKLITAWAWQDMDSDIEVELWNEIGEAAQAPDEGKEK